MRREFFAAAALLTFVPYAPGHAGGFLALGQPDNIARDGLAFGTQYNDADPNRAQRMSLAQCQVSEASERARNACKIIGPLIDQCYALALDSRASPHGVGLAMAEERQRAALLAMEKCRKTAGPAHRDSCAIIANGCDGEANFVGTPRDAKAFRERATAYFNKSDLYHAIADYSQAIALDAKDAIAYNGRGGAYLREDDFNRALTDFNEAIAIDAKYAAAYNNRGTLYKAKHDNDAAIADYSQAIALDPQSTIPFINRGVAYESKHDYDHAIADYSAALKLEPKNTFAFARRDIAEEAKQDYVHAIADYGAAVALNPKDAGSLYFRGMAKLRGGDKTGGDADIAAAKAIKPDIAEQYPSNTLK